MVAAHLEGMSPTALVSESLRQLLQLSLGARANLGEEIQEPGCRAFAATTPPDGAAAVVTVHRAPSEGPDPAVMCHRVAGLQELNHRCMNVPLAAGDLGGHAWVLEPVSSLPSARERLAAGPVSLPLAVSAIRDISRVLATMHRRGITHGNITLDTVRINSDGARLGGAGHSLRGSVRSDLDALGEVAWALLSGELRAHSTGLLSSVRRGVAPSLDAFCLMVRATDPRRRPQRAEAFLEGLDDVPSGRPAPVESIVDTGSHDGRPHRSAAWMVIGVALLLLLVLLLAHG